MGPAINSGAATGPETGDPFAPKPELSSPGHGNRLEQMTLGHAPAVEHVPRAVRIKLAAQPARVRIECLQPPGPCKLCRREKDRKRQRYQTDPRQRVYQASGRSDGSGGR